jgi:ubiquinone/menaquinone biosynthesis C-methylase UbiE
MKANAASVRDSDEATLATVYAYDRASRWYDLQEWLPEKLAMHGWRRGLWSRVPAGTLLEVGVGTGRNLPFYAEGHAATAIDISPKMLAKAERKAKQLQAGVDLRVMDAQQLDFPDASFDSAVATFVFCSVPDPVLGLREVRRVIKPRGQLFLIEHVLSKRQPLRWIMERLNGVARTVNGANIDRDTVRNVETAGFAVLEVQDLWGDIVKLIVAERTT